MKHFQRTANDVATASADARSSLRAVRRRPPGGGRPCCTDVAEPLASAPWTKRNCPHAIRTSVLRTRRIFTRRRLHAGVYAAATQRLALDPPSAAMREANRPSAHRLQPTSNPSSTESARAEDLRLKSLLRSNQVSQRASMPTSSRLPEADHLTRTPPRPKEQARPYPTVE